MSPRNSGIQSSGPLGSLPGGSIIFNLIKRQPHPLSTWVWMTRKRAGFNEAFAMFVQNLGFLKKKLKTNATTSWSSVLVLHPHWVLVSFLLRPAVLHEVCANGSIANYPQMARLWGTIKENASSDAGTLCFIEWHEKVTSLILQ